MNRFVVGLALLSVSSFASAEPIGRWFEGYGQGTSEYGIKNDSAGSDYFYIAFPSDGAMINLTVSGRKPKARSTAVVTIGRDEYQLYIDQNGEFSTTSRVEDDTFRALWSGIRRGADMRIRLASGQSTSFTLRGASRALPAVPCDTSFQQ